MINNILDIFKGLLPNNELPTPVWVVRLLLVSSIFTFLSGASFYAIKDTELGQEWGLSRRKTMNMRQFQNITRYVNTNLAIIELRHPEIDSSFLVANYNDDGNFVAGRSGNLGIMAAYIPDAELPPSIYAIEDVINLRARDVIDAVLNQKRCYSAEIREQNIESLQRAIPGLFADQTTICPIQNLEGEAYASVIVLWKAPVNNVAATTQLEREIIESTASYSKQIQDNLNSQPNLLMK